MNNYAGRYSSIDEELSITGYGTYSNASNGITYYQQYSDTTSNGQIWYDPLQGGSWTSPSSTPTPTPTPILIPVPPSDEIKSLPKDEKDKEGHVLSGTLKIYGDTVVVEYFCSHCNEVLFRQVISKVPKAIQEGKCLPRLVKEVK